jgi:hypothetical protein
MYKFIREFPIRILFKLFERVLGSYNKFSKNSLTISFLNHHLTYMLFFPIHKLFIYLFFLKKAFLPFGAIGGCILSINLIKIYTKRKLIIIIDLLAIIASLLLFIDSLNLFKIARGI